VKGQAGPGIQGALEWGRGAVLECHDEAIRIDHLAITWRQTPPPVTSSYSSRARASARESFYGMFMSADEPMPPEQIAAEFSLPLEAVKEAIAYRQSKPPEIAQDFEREERCGGNR